MKKTDGRNGPGSKLLGLWMACVLAGCNGGDHLSSLPRSLVSDGGPAPDRLAANRLSADHLASSKALSNQLASNALSAGPISPDTFSLAETDLIETDVGREVLTYLVTCALAVPITLIGTDSQGEQYEFFGELGIAPEWLDAPLSDGGKRWVSACLFSRVNANHTAVPISMRGPNNALTVTREEEAGWTLQEGAFYGMYFTAADERINWIACRGMDSEPAHQQLRDCAYPDPRNPGKTLCGFNFAGDCGRYTKEPTSVACQEFSAEGYYVHCADQAIFTAIRGVGGEASDPQVFDEVITTYVQP